MDGLDKLFDFVQSHQKTVVFGNLGRLPHVLSAYLSQRFPTFDILVSSKYYKFPSTDRIRLTSPEDSGNKKCDLLVYCEPVPYSTLGKKPPGAARVVVFASHLIFTRDADYVLVDHFHLADEGRAERMRYLQQLREVSEEHARIETAKVRVDFSTVRSVGPFGSDVNVTPGGPVRPLDAKTYVVVNLTDVGSPLSMLLYFWDAFDYMVDNSEYVQRWCVCFPEGGARVYADFVNRCVDRLFCEGLEDLPRLLSLIPFYTSGAIDRSFDVPRHEFCDMRYVAPETAVDAFRACVEYDLVHVGGAVYRLR